MESTHPSLTIVGLGTGTWESLTVEAAQLLTNAEQVYVRTAIHPSLDPIRARLPHVAFHSFDRLYDGLPSLADIYQRIVDEITDALDGGSPAIYAVPGSPSVGETTVRMLLERCRERGHTVRLVQGLSYVEPVLAAVGVTDAGWIQVLDAADIALFAAENAVGEVPGEDKPLPWRAPLPTTPLLVSYLYSREAASGVKLWLGRYYPDEHQVQLIQAPGTPESSVRTLPLYELDRQPDVDHRTAVFVPPLAEMENVRTFAGMMQLTRRLRGPGGCPWDREQTHESLKPYLLEETYEVLDALDSGDPSTIADEFGDLLYQITIHAQVAAEAGTFTIEDVIQSIMTKLIGRHPHVFGDVELHTAQDVRQAWEALKQRQKPKRESVLEEIPRGLPALPQSNLMQKRAASVGFEWPSVEGSIAKVEEEMEELLAEIREGGAKERQREELGDILFALVGIARHLRIDPEEALRLANHRFAARFTLVEAEVRARGATMRDLTTAELLALWDQAKRQVSGTAG